jgi:hypothetical protein
VYTQGALASVGNGCRTKGLCLYEDRVGVNLNQVILYTLTLLLKNLQLDNKVSMTTTHKLTTVKHKASSAPLKAISKAFSQHTNKASHPCSTSCSNPSERRQLPVNLVLLLMQSLLSFSHRPLAYKVAESILLRMFNLLSKCKQQQGYS